MLPEALLRNTKILMFILMFINSESFKRCDEGMIFVSLCVFALLCVCFCVQGTAEPTQFPNLVNGGSLGPRREWTGHLGQDSFHKKTEKSWERDGIAILRNHESAKNTEKPWERDEREKREFILKVFSLPSAGSII